MGWPVMAAHWPVEAEEGAGAREEGQQGEQQGAEVVCARAAERLASRGGGVNSRPSRERVEQRRLGVGVELRRREVANARRSGDGGWGL